MQDENDRPSQADAKPDAGQPAPDRRQDDRGTGDIRKGGGASETDARPDPDDVPEEANSTT